MQLVPIEQAVAAVITDRIIMRSSPTAAQIVSRANTALAYAAVLAAIEAGNAAEALTAYNAIVVDPTLDPVIANELQALIGVGIQQLTNVSQLGNLVPLFGSTVTAFFGNLVAGITSAANTLIAANSTAGK